jgi:hypothetical protein
MRNCILSIFIMFASFVPLNAQQTSSNIFMIIQEDNKELELERVISFYDSVKDYQDGKPIAVRKHYLNVLTEKGDMVIEGTTPTGTFTGYSPDGVKIAEYTYDSKGDPSGTFKEFDKKTGAVKSVLTFKDGKQTSQTDYDEDGYILMKDESTNIFGSIYRTERTIYNYSEIFGYKYDQEIWRKTSCYVDTKYDGSDLKTVKDGDGNLLFVEEYFRDGTGLGITYTDSKKDKVLTKYLVIPSKNLTKRTGIFELVYGNADDVVKVCYYSLMGGSSLPVCSEETGKITEYTATFNKLLESRETADKTKK